MTDSGSAIYGSDAIGGVVNFILRKDFDGVSVKARYGDATDGGYQNGRIDIVAGKDFEDKRILFIGQFAGNEMLQQTDRDWAGDDGSDRSQFSAYSSYGANFYGEDGSHQRPDDCKAVVGSAGVEREDGKCGFNRAAYRSLKPENKQVDLLFRGEYDISDNVTAMAEEQFKKSVETMNHWFEIAKTTEEKPEPHAYITLASAYVQMEDFKSAIVPTKKAISLSKSPSESWYLLLMASHYELGQFKSVAGVLKTLTSKYPQKKRYWMQLSGIYMELNQERNSLATLEMAYKLGLLEEEKEYLRLVNFQAYRGIPYRAAKTLEKAMLDGYISKSEKNIERLASFWQQAKEVDNAVVAYRHAFEMNPTVKNQLRITRLMLQDQQYRQAASFTQEKSNDAKADDIAELAYLRGMAFFELSQPASALQAMQAAARSSEIKSAAQPWINFLKDQS